MSFALNPSSSPRAAIVIQRLKAIAHLGEDAEALFASLSDVQSLPAGAELQRGVVDKGFRGAREGEVAQDDHRDVAAGEKWGRNVEGDGEARKIGILPACPQESFR